MWDPNEERMVHHGGVQAARDLARHINLLSQRDAGGGSGGTPVQLRVLEEGDECVPGGEPVLIWTPSA
jgi:hypothetical protein